MNKFRLFVALSSFLSFYSCQEIGPNINFEEAEVAAGDTTYVLTNVPAPQARAVLVEEFTGVSCPNCPAGAQIIKSLKETYQDRVVALGLHKENLNFTNPVEHDPYHTEDDFRTPVANAIDHDIYNGQASNLPIAGIDRTSFNGSLLLARNLWVSNIESQLALTSPLKIDATSAYSEEDGMLKVKMIFTFTSELNDNVYFTAGIIQDSIIDAQINGLTYLGDYMHNHVFRGLISSNGVNGVQLPASGYYEKGRVFERTINVKLLDKLAEQSSYLNTAYVVPEHCHIFIIAHSGNNKEVIQAHEIHLK